MPRGVDQGGGDGDEDGGERRQDSVGRCSAGGGECHDIEGNDCDVECFAIMRRRKIN